MANNKQDKILNVPNKREQRQTCLNVAEREALRPKGSVPNKREQQQTRLNVPALRFPEFKGEWESIPLSNISIIVGRIGFRGYTTNDIVKEGEGAIALSPTNIDNNQLTYNKDNTYISLYKYDESPEIQINIGDIVFVKTGSTIGKVAYVDNIITKTTLNPQLVVLKNISCEKYFLSLVLSTDCFQNHIKRITVGGAVPTLSQVEMGKIQIALPNKKEQQKIQSLMKLLDARIATQRKIIEKLESLIHGVVTTHFHRTRNKNTITIKDLGKAYSVGNLSKEDLAEDGEPCILYGELFTTYGCVANKIQSRTNKYTQATLSRAGDLLFPASTTVDAISLIAPTSLKTEGVYVAGDMFGIRIKSQYNSEYISYIINYVYNRKLSKYAQGSTIIHLHYADIKNVTIQVPCLEEQNKCADLLSCLQMKLDTERRLCVSFQKQKDYLLQQMFI